MTPFTSYDKQNADGSQAPFLLPLFSIEFFCFKAHQVQLLKGTHFRTRLPLERLRRCASWREDEGERKTNLSAMLEG